jgi:pyruvate dehydrogenase E1 component alpha subunit
MKIIREFEERLHAEIAKGEIAGFTHLYAGQEAVAVGVCENLGPQDFIVSTHRGHGHCIAKGCDVKGMMKEIYGRRDGLCKGKGGSMHIADITWACSARMASSAARRRRWCGHRGEMDGGSLRGVQRRRRLQSGHDVPGHEHGVVLQLPVIFVFENATTRNTGCLVRGRRQRTSPALRFRVIARKGDGCDFLATHALMAEIVEYCRSGKGPAAVELDTERFYGHFEGDPQRYRGPGEIARIRETRDCLKIFREQVTAKRWLKASELDQIDAEVDTLIEEAVTEARAAPPPRGEDVLVDVYASY